MIVSSSAITNNAAGDILLLSRFTWQGYVQNKFLGKRWLDQRMYAFKILIDTATCPALSWYKFTRASVTADIPGQYLNVWVIKMWIKLLEHLSSSVCHLHKV